MKSRILILFLCGILAQIHVFSQSRKECKELLAEQDSAIVEYEKQLVKMQEDIVRLVETNKTSYEKYLTAKEDIDRYKFYAEQRLEEIKFLRKEIAALKKGDGGKDSIDKAFEDCLDADTNNGITSGMVQCAYLAQKAWDKELNKYYNLLMSKLSADEKARLKIAQKNWIAYRDAEESFSGTAYGNTAGTMYRVFAADRYMQITRDRVMELSGYYYDIFDYEHYFEEK
jgi:uncharacterized protein YecT (DUF1311 family)